VQRHNCSTSVSVPCNSDFLAQRRYCTGRHVTENPDNIVTDGESERISRVYESYALSARHFRYEQGNPGNRAIVDERVRHTQRLLRNAGLNDLRGRRVLDVGCGYGHELARMRQFGARASDLVGVDLMPDRIAQARQTYTEIEFHVANAVRLTFPDASFDIVLSYTVLSSVLDHTTARQITAEMSRVLKPGGVILWYDIRTGNPTNRNVRGIPAATVRDLFPGFRPILQSLTLAPPLARRLGIFAGGYPVLGAVPFLRSHLLGMLIKPRQTGEDGTVVEGAARGIDSGDQSFD
jgi:ubiquinone/menaquinone biosynthesis C-methylase UbiE